MIKFKCNKLVRDKTLERMERFGIIAKHKLLNEKEHAGAVMQKLVEESLEVRKAPDRNEIITELADVFEVIDALKKIYTITQDEIIAAQNRTFQERGGFEKGIFLETVEMHENNEWVKKLRESPEKYQEV